MSGSLPDAVNSTVHRTGGLPKAGIPAFVSLYLLLGVVPAVLLMISGDLVGSDGDVLLENFWAYLGAVSILLLLTIVGLKRGDVWGIRLFRAVARCLMAMMVFTFVAGLLLGTRVMGGRIAGAQESGLFSLVAIVACCIPAWLLLSGLRHVRWLDPRSLPSEWEPPIAQTE